MYSKVLFGTLISAALGLGAAAVSADEYARTEYNFKKASKIDKDDYFCSVPIKVKGYPETLSSYDADITVKKIDGKHYKKYILVKCNFKDKVDYYYYNDFKAKGFKCKFDHGYDKLKTDQSRVYVDFEKKYYKHGYKPKHIVAKVYLECLFEKPYYHKPNDNYKPHDDYDNKGKDNY